MYRGVFTLGVVVTRDTLLLASALTNRFYINDRNDRNTGRAAYVARCLTGLGPSGNDKNDVLGGLHFNGNMIPNTVELASCSSAGIEVKPGPNVAGVINMFQCGGFSTSREGIYTCTMMNSSMLYQSVRFGVYFSGRSESMDLFLCIPIIQPSFIS